MVEHVLCFHNSRRLDVDLPTHLETVGKLLVGSHLAGVILVEMRSLVKYLSDPSLLVPHSARVEYLLHGTYRFETTK